MTKYVLKAATKNMGTIYYMNVICVTEQVECAEYFTSIKEAQREVQHFKNLVRDDSVEIEIVDRDGEIIDSTDKDTAERWSMNQ